MAELSKRMDIIEQTVRETDPELYQWILQGVTDEFATFKYLHETKGMPCGHRQYYERRRKFYYMLSQKI